VRAHRQFVDEDAAVAGLEELDGEVTSSRPGAGAITVSQTPFTCWDSTTG
jgi:hypothetical protein